MACFGTRGEIRERPRTAQECGATTSVKGELEVLLLMNNEQQILFEESNNVNSYLNIGHKQ